MRAFRAGILLALPLLLMPTPPAYGQEVTGFVESIGFGRSYRPECWTPLLVNLTNTLAEPAEYDIVIEQEDLDSDTAVYRRRVTLNAGRQDKFWCYFLPRTTLGSLPANPAELKVVLRVSLYTAGGKFVAPLPLTTAVDNIDDRQSNRGAKLVLAVMGQEGGLPGPREYEGALGLIEDVVFVRLGTADLPENELGYDGVDAVLWLNADAADLERAGSRRKAVLERYVRRGGHLVVCQPNERGRIENLADLLPVEVKRGTDWVLEMRDRAKLEPLHSLAQPGGDRTRKEDDRWDRIPGPFKTAYAPAKPGALVERWVDWDNPASPGDAPPKNGSPYIARIGQGLGTVTWVAQDFTAPGPNSYAATGWPHAWDAVFGWRNQTHTQDMLRGYREANVEELKLKGERIKDDWASKGRVNLGRAMLQDTDHTGKAGTYVALAIFFFIAYWLVAGPGGYVFLAGKGRKQLSWAVFALSALGATLLTVGVVKLVLRGDPEVRHFTIVRQAAGEDPVAISRVGLYIPRDGLQTVTLPGVAPGAISTLHALAIHPKHLTVREGFLDTGRYNIAVRDDLSGAGEVGVAFPYRSTLKKLQAERVGPLQGGITGGPMAILPPYPIDDPKDPRVKLPRGYIQGKLTNNTGADLHNVFIAFRYTTKQDWMLYLPSWGAGQTIDVEVAFNSAVATWAPQSLGLSDLVTRPRRGFLTSQWSPLFHAHMARYSGAMGISEGDVPEQNGLRANLVVMSLFDRLTPQKNGANQAHVDLIRREGRELDLSAALAAGRVVVLAAARDVPLPYPMHVEGDPVTGPGSVFYQFVLPADRTKVDAEEAGQAAADRAKPDDGTEPAVEKQ